MLDIDFLSRDRFPTYSKYLTVCVKQVKYSRCDVKHQLTSQSSLGYICFCQGTGTCKQKLHVSLQKFFGKVTLKYTIHILSKVINTHTYQVGCVKCDHVVLFRQRRIFLYIRIIDAFSATACTCMKKISKCVSMYIYLVYGIIGIYSMSYKRNGVFTYTKNTYVLLHAHENISCLRYFVLDDQI